MVHKPLCIFIFILKTSIALAAKDNTNIQELLINASEEIGFKMVGIVTVAVNFINSCNGGSKVLGFILLNRNDN